MSASTSAYGFSFPGYECQTARSANLAGPKNGPLLAAAEAGGFDVLQNIPHQQKLAGRKIAVAILCGPTSRLRDLLPLVPAAIEALDSIQPGDLENPVTAMRSGGSLQVSR